MTASYDNPAELGEPLGKYSHLSYGGGLTFVAGQVGVRADGSLASPEFSGQMRQVFSNIRAALESRGGAMTDILKFTTYLTDASLVSSFYEVREELFAELYPEGGYPPNTLLVIDRLVRPEYLLEVEAIAHVEAGATERS